MSALFDDASSQYLEGSFSPADAPLTMAAWFRPDDLDVTQSILTLSDEAHPTSHFFRLRYDGGSGKIFAESKNGSGSTYRHADSSAGPSLNTWCHAAAVIAADNYRAAFLNGRNKGTDTTTSSFVGDRTTTSIGRLPGVGSEMVSGRVAEAAVWSVALTDGEIAMLGAGVSPLRVRPAGLVGYWPLYTGAGVDRSGHGNTLTPYNGPTQADHAPVSPPLGRDIGVPFAVSAVATYFQSVAAASARTAAASAQLTLTAAVEATSARATAIFKGLSKTVAGVASRIAVIRKGLFVTSAANSSRVAAVAPATLLLQGVGAASVRTIVFTRAISKALASTSARVAGMIKRVSKTVLANSTRGAGLQKGAYRTVAAASVRTAAVNDIGVLGGNISAMSARAAAMLANFIAGTGLPGVAARLAGFFGKFGRMGGR